MSVDDQQVRDQWREVIARIAAQIDEFKARIDSESQRLYSQLSTEVAALQADLRTLEAEVKAYRPDAYASRIAAQIENLQAQGDAAYHLLQTHMAAELDPVDTEIRRLEAAALRASPQDSAKLLARVDELKATRRPSASAAPIDSATEHAADAPS